jgi:hypothetical protein
MLFFLTSFSKEKVRNNCLVLSASSSASGQTLVDAPEPAALDTPQLATQTLLDFDMTQTLLGEDDEQPATQTR